MNDKEAFEKWFSTWNRAEFPSLSLGVWQAACEYKQKEIDELISILDLKKETNVELQAENKKLREALVECPIVGEIHRDSNERFKEWNLIHRNTIREALKEVGEE